jgi:hypothetical protein
VLVSLVEVEVLPKNAVEKDEVLVGSTISVEVVVEFV